MKSVVVGFMTLMLLLLMACNKGDNSAGSEASGAGNPSKPLPPPTPTHPTRISQLSQAELTEVHKRLLDKYHDAHMSPADWKVVGSYFLLEYLSAVLRLRTDEFQGEDLKRDFVLLFNKLHDSNGVILEKLN